MRLTDFLQEIGRPIAYYPKLRRITGSTTATIFLCQLIYWSGKQKDPDGWIYKTAAEIEEETGLSPKEQRTARRHLKGRGLLDERYDRLNHRMYYRVDFDAINAAWEEFCKGRSRTDQREVREMPDGEVDIGTETTTETTNSYAADAAQPPAPDDDFEQLFPPRFSQPPRTRAANGARSNWGEHSETAERLLQRYGDRAPALRALGEMLEGQFGLVPDWGSKQAVKRWIAGLDRLLSAADGDLEIARRAARKLLEDGLTVADPWSLVKTAVALAAERRRGGAAMPSSTPVRVFR